MNDDRLHIAILIAGGSEGVAERIASRACRRTDIEVDLIDLDAACLPEACDDVGPVPHAVLDLAPWLAAADAFVVVTPQRHLKNVLDWFATEWQDKPVAFASVDDVDLMLDQLTWWARALGRARAN